MNHKNGELLLTHLTDKDAGSYRCRGTNYVRSEVQSLITLYVASRIKVV